MAPTGELLTKELLGRLRQPESSEAAWLQAREIARAEPATAAAPLCALLADTLSRGLSLPISTGVLITLNRFTRDAPECVPADLLREILAQADHLDPLAVLATANMLSRHRAEAILTQGIKQVLAATELVVDAGEPGAEQVLADFSRGVADELWARVARDDPATIIALLEQWIMSGRGASPCARYFVRFLSRAAPRNPELVGDMIETARAMLESLDPSDAGRLEVERELAGLRREVLVKVAEEILQEELPPPAGQPPELPPADYPPPAPDPKVDRVLEDFTSGDEAARSEAGKRLGGMFSSPSPALVWGACELVEESACESGAGGTTGELLAMAALACRTMPSLVPVPVLRRLIVHPSLTEPERISAFAMLTVAEPGWVARHARVPALASVIRTGSLLGGGVLANLGTNDPEWFVRFMVSWFARAGWEGLGPLLAAAAADIGRRRPEFAGQLLKALRDQLGPQEHGKVDLRTDLHGAVSKLEEIAAEKGR